MTETSRRGLVTNSKETDLNLMESSKKELSDSVQFSLNHPLKDRPFEEKYAYVNALAAVVATGNNPKMPNLKYIEGILTEFGIKTNFENLISHYRMHPEKINIQITVIILKKNDCFSLLVLDAAMIQPRIYAESQDKARTFLKELGSRSFMERPSEDWYKAVFCFATALAGAGDPTEFLIGTTKRLFIPACWTHILKFKKLLSDETVILPELCRVFSPDTVGMMFESGNFTLSENGEQRLMSAVFRQSRVAVEFLLSKGADINAVDREGMTALDQWGFLLSLEFFEFMLDHGAKLSHTSIGFCIMLKRHELVRSIMQHGVEIPVDCIIQVNLDLKVARVYLENGGNPNLKNPDGFSWIDNEVSLDHQEIVALLKEFGAVPSPDVKPFQEEMDELIKLLEGQECKAGKK